MATNWYESQLAGIFIGSILGFLFAYLPKIIEEKSKRRKLQKALKSEISLIIEQSQKTISVIEEVVKALPRDEPCTIENFQFRVRESTNTK